MDFSAESKPMELTGKIEPGEVLSHLNKLGYQDITPTQLKEFIRDLKKLIIYDQLSSSRSSGSLTSLSSTVSSGSDGFTTSDTLSSNIKTSHSKCDTKMPVSRGLSVHLRGKSTNLGTDKGENAVPKPPVTVCSGSSLRRSSTSSSSLSGRVSQKENVPSRRGRTVSASQETLQEAVKPKSSFIRPWKLQGAPSGSSRAGPSDPVTMYQYYQSVWNKHKCPGEDSHADLRWVIREKMLGQDPHLYSKNVGGKKNNRLRM